MGPIVHLSFTATLLTGARLAGYNVNTEIAVASLIGGIFLDGDKAIEIVVSREKKKKGEIPDITARCRILISGSRRLGCNAIAPIVLNVWCVLRKLPHTQCHEFCILHSSFCISEVQEVTP